MLMVYLIGLGACVSFYFMYRNKKNISFQLLKYYTYLDEFFTKFSKSEDTKFLYPYKDSFVDSSNLKPSLINIKEYGFPYIITRDFIVKEDSDESTRKSREYFNIYKILSNENDLIEESSNVIELVKPLQLGIQSIEYENLFIERCFHNHMMLLGNIEWEPSIIAASISIVDKNNVYTFREFDVTKFLISLLREGKVLELNNEVDSKILWLHFFNYLFKSKNILIPCDKNELENYEITWTVVFDTCEVKEGSNITLDMTTK